MLRYWCKHVSVDIRVDGERINEPFGLAELGVYKMTLPREFGGLGFNQQMYLKTMEVLGGHCASTAVFVNAHHSIGCRALVLFGTKEQQARWLPGLLDGTKLCAFALTEPEAGSDAGNVQTTAAPTADGQAFLLNGVKHYITNGGIADVHLVVATIDPDLGIVVHDNFENDRRTGRRKAANFLRNGHVDPVPAERQAAIRSPCFETSWRDRVPGRIVEVGAAGVGGDVVGAVRRSRRPKVRTGAAILDFDNPGIVVAPLSAHQRNPLIRREVDDGIGPYCWCIRRHLRERGRQAALVAAGRAARAVADR